MRKTIALIIALVSLAAAGTAAADVSPSYQQIITSPGEQSCADHGTNGSWIGSIGGYYHDGCTARIRCYRLAGCDAVTTTGFNPTYQSNVFRVSQNARIRVLDAYGNVLRFHDKSCSGFERCGTSDWMRISYGQTASIQCNGVHYSTQVKPYYNYCDVEVFAIP